MPGPYKVKDVLDLEISPALGCTEPSAIALCAAASGSLLGSGEVEAVEVWMDMNLYKNGFAVCIPGTRGEAGLDLAAALGALGGDPDRRLEVLASIDDETVRRAKDLIRAGRVKVNLASDRRGLYVRAMVRKEGRAAEAVIEDVHDNIVRLRVEGRPVESHPLLAEVSASNRNVVDLEKWLTTLSVEELVGLLDDLDEDDLEFLEEGVRYNLRLAEFGLKYGPGLGIGSTLERLCREGLIKKDIILAARILTSAAADARMSGARLPAMSSAGSGNHGLTAILPIWAVKDYLPGMGRAETLKAIALSHILTAYLKAHTGRLSAICGCSVAAGSGAAAGVTYLMGGNIAHISGAVVNLIMDLAGVICDGAKTGCALKLATAAGAAVQSALFSLHGVNVKHTDGIIGLNLEQTVNHVGRLSTQGMIEADRTILRIMVEKHLQPKT
ncbi:MAG: L-serine ammonia-lyase, iron-sulfur-dependent, subunit alpha [Thermodesulfobacteriota bacterium]